MTAVEWSGSTLIQASKVTVPSLPMCEVHPTVSQHVAGVLSISWESSGTGVGQVYACEDCAIGPCGRIAAALDDAIEGTIVRVESQVLEMRARIARAA